MTIPAPRLPLRRTARLAASGLALLAFTLGTLRADDYTWTGEAGNTAWDQEANWMGGSSYPQRATDNIVGNLHPDPVSVAADTTIGGIQPTTNNWTLLVGEATILTLKDTLKVEGLQLVTRGPGEVRAKAVEVVSTPETGGVYTTTSGGTIGVRLVVGEGGTTLTSGGTYTTQMNLGPLDEGVYAAGGSNLGLLHFAGEQGARSMVLLFNPTGNDPQYSQTVRAEGLDDESAFQGPTRLIGGLGKSGGQSKLEATLHLEVAGTHATRATLEDGTDGGFLALRKTGKGSQELGGASTYTHGTVIGEGTLVAANGLALGVGPVTVEGGRLLTKVASLEVGGDLAMTSGTMALNGTEPGAVRLGGGHSLTLSGGTLELTVAGADRCDQFLGGGGTFAVSNLVIDLSGSQLEAGTYSLFSGFASGTVSNVRFRGIERWKVTLDDQGNLVVATF